MNYFKGALGGKRVADFSNYDNTVRSYDKRLNFVEENIMDDGNAHQFFQEYFDNYYNASQDTAEYNVVCKLLDNLGTYLLSSDDIESNRKIKYRFWRSEREFKQYKESTNELTLNSKAEGSSDDGSDVEYIDMFVDKKNEKNDYKMPPVQIRASDLKNVSHIKELEDAIELLKSDGMIKNVQKYIEEALPNIRDEDEKSMMKNIYKNVDRYLKVYAKTLRDNQLLIKNAIDKPVILRNPAQSVSVERDWSSIIDFKDTKTTKNILKECLDMRDMAGSDAQVMMNDLYEYLLSDGLKLSEGEKTVVRCLGKGMSQTLIAERTGRKKQNVASTLNSICDKLAKSNYKVVD
nr:MAG TPA: ECF sigma factor [Caudoviricetes sp.]